MEQIEFNKGLLNSIREHPLAAIIVAIAGICVGSFWAGRTTGDWHFFSTSTHLVVSELGAIAALVIWYGYSRLASRASDARSGWYLAVDALSYIPFLVVGIYILYSTRLLAHIFFPAKLDRLIAFWALGAFIGIKITHLLYFHTSFSRWLFYVFALIASLTVALWTIGSESLLSALVRHHFYVRWQLAFVLLYALKFIIGAYTSRKYIKATLLLIVVAGLIAIGSKGVIPSKTPVTQPVNPKALAKYLPKAEKMRLIPNDLASSMNLVRVSVAGEARNALYMPPPSKVEIPVKLKGPTNIFLGVAMLSPSYTGEGDGALFKFSYKAKAGDAVPITEKYINPKSIPEDRKWHDIHLDLTGVATGTVNLIIETSGSANREKNFSREPDMRDDFAVVSEPIQYMLEPENAEKPDIFIILLDALRFDHLGVYGYERPTSPKIDAISADGIVFENAEAHASWTLSSVASLFTGLYPYENGVSSLKQVFLDPGPNTIAEYLKGAGYVNASFAATPILGDQYNYGQGFDFFSTRCGAYQGFASSGCLTKQVLAWADNAPTGPRFAYIHYFDPHAPYNSPDPFKGKFSAPYKGVRPEVSAGEINEFDQQAEVFGWHDLTDTELKHLMALYDEEILYVDTEIGKLIKHLKDKGKYDNSMIIVLSDHGDAFSEHGRLGHGQSLYEVLTHIPLIIKLPGNEMAGRRVGEPVGMADILPTVLDAAGGITPPKNPGRVSLMGLMRGGEIPERDLFFQRGAFIGAEQYAVRRGFAKFHVDYSKDKTTRTESLFDLSVDPEERHNIIAQEPELAASLRKSLDAYIEKAVKAQQKRKQRKHKPDSEMDKRLRALGYIGGRPSEKPHEKK